MKSCPTCNRTYPNDTLALANRDGNAPGRRGRSIAKVANDPMAIIVSGRYLFLVRLGSVDHRRAREFGKDRVAYRSLSSHLRRAVGDIRFQRPGSTRKEHAVCLKKDLEK